MQNECLNLHHHTPYAIRLEAIATTMEAIPTRMEALAIRLEAIAIKLVLNLRSIRQVANSPALSVCMKQLFTLALSTKGCS